MRLFKRFLLRVCFIESIVESKETRPFNNEIDMIMNPIPPNPTDTAFQHTPTKVSLALDSSLRVYLGLL